MTETANGSERVPGPLEVPAPASDEINPPTANRRTFWPVIVMFLFVIALLSAGQMPAPVRTFVALSVIAGALVVGGFVTLIVLIPAARSNPDVKTEFLSARAAYLCVLAGLALFGIVAIGAVVARVMLNLGRN